MECVGLGRDLKHLVLTGRWESMPTEGITLDAARDPGRGVLIVHVIALALAAALIVLTASSAHWTIWPLLVIATFTILSGVTYAETGSQKINVQGTPLGLMLAAVLLGAGPAAILGAVAICFMQLRFRRTSRYFRNNLVTFVWYPLVGGLVFHAVVAVAHLSRFDLGFYLAVVPAFACGLAVNFVGVAGYQCWLDRSSFAQKAREAVVPVLPAELVAILLTMGAACIAVQTGTLGIVLIGVMLLIFQYLVGQLLKSKSRGEKLHRLATIDGLSGLANRDAFSVRVEEAIAAADADTRLAVMLIDLDRFKEINDTLGHHYGDELLRELGPRLAACVGEAGLVARLGGDEFVVLVGQPTDDPEALDALGGRLLACVQEQFEIDELSISVVASIGISRFPIDGHNLNDLLRCADVAMYAAKEAHSGCKLYAATLDHHSVRRLSLLGDFQRGLSGSELVVHFQPIICPDDLVVRGAEGLIRWMHPEHGLLPPGAFVETVEQTEMIRPLTLFVLERSIAQCAQWRRSGRDLSVSVNLSVRNLLDVNLPQEVDVLLKRYGLSPAALQLEITESMIMSDPERGLATVEQLNLLGVRLSVDDFGTGFSSLAILKRLPIDELKIDRSFVSQMLVDESDLIIVRSMINLGHDLGLRVVAEGVEDASTLKYLATLGCDLVQGFYVSKPLTAEAFADWLGPIRTPSLIGAAV
jgi:diguanylate cyclase (GGDEF)-like protein